MMRALDPTLRSYLPASLEAEGADATRRARAVLVAAGLMSLGGAWIGWVQLRVGSPVAGLAAATVSALSVTAALLVMQRGAWRAAGLLLSLTLFLAAGTVVVMTGAALVAASYYLGLVPLLATLVLGTRAGCIAAAAGSVLVVGVELLRRSGFGFAVAVTPEVAAQSAFRGALLFQFVLLAIATIYDRLRQGSLDTVAETQLRYRALVEHSRDVVFEVDESGMVRFVSPSHRLALGWPDELPGESALERIHPDDAERVRRRFREVLELGSSASATARIAVADGRWCWFELTGTAYETSEGRRVVVVGRDLTERMRLEEGLRQSQKMEAIGQLAGGVAHDFNNLLTVIAGYADEIASSQPPGSDAQTAATEVLKAAEQGEALTRRLLGVSRPGDSRRSAVDVNRVVTEIERMLGRLLGEQVVLQLELEPALPAVLADPSHLEQILVNLAVNARDAMPGGGTLRIVTGARDGRVRLEVSDTGVGMDAQTRQRIFEAFFTTKPRGHGTGLGLSVVYSLVKDMGGAIWAESEHGQGTRMLVELPGAPESVHRRETPDPVPLPTRREVGHETVLVAEDGGSVRYLVTRALEEAGYRVLTARDGQEALDVAESFPEPIDLVVSDVVMPRLGGFDLVRRLRSARPGARFLFISGHPERTGAPSTDLADVPLLAKPFRPAELCARVRSVLDEG